MYSDGGWLPKGPAGLEYSSIMVASHSIPLIVSAYQKGIRNYDVDMAWESIVHQQTVPGHKYKCGGAVGNMQIEPYLELGYVPTESVYISNTLEYAYDDWCVAQLAKAMGKNKEYKLFMKRSENYKNIFNPELKYINQKRKMGAGGKISPFSSPRNEYVEGNAWQYTFFVPEDVKCLLA